ncbi:hypothetical protein HBI80_022340 [Parastagonospora nodorum]|nr:hypothetical protein HBI80_022340 [Parastagonospora nodorum]KAH5991250.1 hypothetical protein HBI82_192280 [Parastagonospora nodorum]
MIYASPAIWTALCCASPRNSKLTYHSAGLPMVATQLQPYHSKSSCTSAMAEVAGTIFGVISLSIQIFDKVSKYTSAVKDAKTKAEQILAEMEYLADLLEELESITKRACADKSATSAKRGVYQCAQAIEMVKLKLGGDKPVCAKPWAKLKNTFRRLMFPFKEADIKYWKDVLSYIQQHLQTALFALLLDQGALNLSVLQAQISGVSSSLHERIHGIDEHIRRLLEFVDHLKLSGHPLKSLVSRDGELAVLQRTLQLQQQVRVFHELRTPPSRIMHEQTINTGAPTANTCTCYGKHTIKRVLKRPFFWTQATFHTHNRGCPFWSAEGLRTSITFGLILCYFALGMQWRMLLTLSIGTRPISILPGLKCYRAVKASSSPAFRAVDAVFSSSIGAQTIPILFGDLRKIFETRRASTDDRLPNGQTLLHYMCGHIGQRIWVIDKSQLQHCRSLLRLVFDFVKDVASETDDEGNTCVDLLLRATDPADHIWNALVTDLLQAGLQMTPNCHPDGKFPSYGSWVEIPFASFAEPFSHHYGPADIVLTKSDHHLKQYLQEISYTSAGDITAGETQRLYKLATRMGWVAGCEILFEAGLAYMPQMIEEPPNRLSVSEPLIHDAIESRNPQMVLFWLQVRDDASTNHLPYIGNIETALVHASEICHNEEIAEILLSHLVSQRNRLQQLASDFDIPDAVSLSDDHLLDIHAACVVWLLISRGVKVPPAIRPFGSSVYSVRNMYQEQPPVYQKSRDPLWIFQRLYDSGFGQMTAGKCSHCLKPTCPPLVFAMVSYRRFYPSSGPLPRFFKIAEWFLSHGADIMECWPNSKTTALHCMATKAAMLSWGEPVDRISSQSLTATLSHNFKDTCKCSCSTSGCTALVSFWKASYRFQTGYIGSVSELLDTSAGAGIKPSRFQRIDRWELEHVVRCVEKATTSPTYHWIVVQFIRVLVFSLLGIRHTCCNLAKIEFIREPDFEKMPWPRYTPDETEKIQEEDRFRKGLLEFNVKIFEGSYSQHKGSLQSFVDKCLLPRMSYVLGGTEVKRNTIA